MDMYLNCNHRSHDLLQVWLGDCYDAFSGTDFTFHKSYDRSMTNPGPGYPDYILLKSFKGSRKNLLVDCLIGLRSVVLLAIVAG